MKFIIAPIFKCVFAIFLSILSSVILMLDTLFYFIWHFSLPKSEYYIYEFRVEYSYINLSPYLKLNLSRVPKYENEQIIYGKELSFKTYLHYIWNKGMIIK